MELGPAFCACRPRPAVTCERPARRRRRQARSLTSPRTPRPAPQS